ncbi:MAG: metal ABC transporter ATP-binding protein [Chloroflexi bacterium]|nr:metal ABC transporter ATP-binding protein [Chloroflexota bacterium]MDA1145095.1 metal ABC transporter ATP-binding protein [Chloroflexota bacterium]
MTSAPPSPSAAESAPTVLGDHELAREPLPPGHEHGELALEVRDLWAGYPGQPPAIEAVDLRVPLGEIVGLVGPNGAGKSTLFKSILGLVEPIRGQVLAFGKPVREARALIAYMPQLEDVDWNFPVSVTDVVLMGCYQRLRPFGGWSRANREAAAEAIERVGLSRFASRQVGELSGGQRRRVLMARSIARGSRLLLLDEPFAGLDAAVQHDLLEILDALVQDGRSVLLATHDLSCVASCSDDVVCLNRRVIASGSPAAVLTEDVLSRTFDRHLLQVASFAPQFASPHPPAQVAAYDEHIAGE